MNRFIRYNRLIATATLASTVSTESPFVSHLSTSTFHAYKNARHFRSEGTFETVKTLMHRLNQPESLRAPSESGDRASTTVSTAPFEEKQRLVELVDRFVSGYHDLPPLRLPALDTDFGTVDKPCERVRILTFLACKCDSSFDAVEEAVQRYLRHKSSDLNERTLPKDMLEALSNLRKALTPSYDELFALILQQNAIAGMEFLVSLREDLLQLRSFWKEQHFSIRESSGHLSQLHDLDSYLQSVFATWFVPGMLDLRRITYEGTSASIIEFISVKEAVHPMKSLKDLRSRLGPRRRVFALFHPLLPERPLVFVHIALIASKGESHDLDSLIPSSMKDVMDLHGDDESNYNHLDEHFTPKVATFYSISNGVKGLAGVGLGEYLLKKAIESLKRELPSLEVFVTLSSPILGF